MLGDSPDQNYIAINPIFQRKFIGRYIEGYVSILDKDLNTGTYRYIDTALLHTHSRGGGCLLPTVIFLHFLHCQGVCMHVPFDLGKSSNISILYCLYKPYICIYSIYTYYISFKRIFIAQPFFFFHCCSCKGLGIGDINFGANSAAAN
jgi:hypothetical protein